MKDRQKKIIKQINPHIFKTISISKLCGQKALLNLSQTEINPLMLHKSGKKTSHNSQTGIKHRSINLTPLIPSRKIKIN
jgi:hypothetical protein